MHTLTLDLPDKKLHPNGGGKWNVYKIAALKKKAEKYAWAIAYSQIGELKAGRVRIDYLFFLSRSSSAKRADCDNHIAWMKKYQDGISKAIGINDKYFEPGSVTFDADPARPRVVITITPVEERK